MYHVFHCWAKKEQDYQTNKFKIANHRTDFESDIYDQKPDSFFGLI